MNARHKLIVALFSGAAASTFFLAPAAVAQPGADCNPDAAADGFACTTGPKTGPGGPGLLPESPLPTGPVTAGCFPGRTCGISDGDGN
jgi:hypothetical protein